MSDKARYKLQLWALRYSTTDYPGKYVARLFENEVAQDLTLVSNDLNVLRDWFQQLGLTSVAPMPGDHENMIEVWL